MKQTTTKTQKKQDGIEQVEQQAGLPFELDSILWKDELVQQIKNDFAERQKSRRPYELSWRLNMNFAMGNQYCAISARGEIEQEEKFFFWQEKQVFNHIAPIVETRVSRLSRVRPKPIVRPFSSSDSDISTARLSSKIIQSVSDKINLSLAISQATMWSEVCGTSFYKVGWQAKKRAVANRQICDEDINLTVCPPFEIFPDSNVSQNIEDCNSIIHARVYSVSDIKRLWNVDVAGSRIAVFSIDEASGVGGLGYNSTVPSITQETKNNQALVIERYTRPDSDNPNGRLEIVAADTLVYAGELPYNIGENAHDFPFVKQTALEQPGCFWGASIVERCIPVQRAFNALKNRKHEFLNRLSMGILTVEDGSVDIENLEEEGLSPGKILVYRQGSVRPHLMETGSIPAEFSIEEEKLLREFTSVSGVSEFATRSATPSTIKSGIMLQQLTEQDDTRLSISTDSIKGAIKKIAKMILRLYKQFANGKRLAKICDNQGKVEVFYFAAADITSCDVVFETENEMLDNLAARRNTVMQMLSSGLLHNREGKLSESTKAKVISMLGFGNWENASDLNGLHIERAARENIDITNAQLLAVDDHDLHIDEHTRFVISGQADTMGKDIGQKVLAHILLHKIAKEGGNTNEQQIQ